MNELVQQLQQKAGLTHEQATKSVDVIREFIQSKLPPMMHGMVDTFMGSLDEAGNEDDYINGKR